MRRAALVCLSIVGASFGARPSLAQSEPSRAPLAENDKLGDGQIESLSIYPAKIELRGTDRSVRIVVTALFANGGVWDVTRKVAFAAADESIARVDSSGVVTPMKDGSTTVRVTLTAGKEHEASVPVTVSHAAEDVPINFANDIVPIFSKHGCNAGGCHGKSGGQNGFQLSLFGYTPSIDYTSLTQESRGRRVFPAAPEHSLLLRKPSGGMPHGGGARFDTDSADYKLIHRWIRSGTPFGRADDPVIQSIAVYPRMRMLSRKGKQQLSVIAIYSDGHSEDVTPRAQYTPGGEDYLEVSGAGLVSALNLPGSASVLVRYQGRIGLFQAVLPSGGDVAKFPKPAPKNFIDEHVFRRLDLLGIPPSEICTDEEFLRRVSIDLTGTLPSAEDAAAFLADKTENRREALIDRLLERPEHASYFALQWADLLRNRRGGEDRASPLTIGFHRWIYESLIANKPFDQFVREILCAEGSPQDNPPVAWYRSLESPKELVDDTAQVFLGTRIQCARCHHHPFEKWAQDDYWRFANFFSRVQRKNDSNSRSFTISIRRGDSRFTDDEPTSASHKKTYVGLKIPGGEVVAETSDEDPRQLLVDWIVSPSNPLFARGVANRYWKHFLGRGIVEPEDDLRETNPPSNPELLDSLAKDFAEHGYDLRRLERVIVSSATYQLSSVPNEQNRADRQSFARYQPSRFSAEVLLDAIDRVTGRKTRFQNTLRDARAIDLPDEASRSYFLEVFGKPDRASACACERSGDVTLAQVVHLLNSREVQEKLSHDEGRSAALAKDSRPLPERVDELFLVAFARHPTRTEQEQAQKHFEERKDDKSAPGASRKAWEDLIWALINSKELYFKR